MVAVTLPDGSVKQAAPGTRIADFVREQIGQGLARAALAAKVNGAVVDISRPLDAFGDAVKLEVITEKQPEGLEVIRHSAAHVLASAVQRVFPDAQVTIGPVIEDGFYYDFKFDRGFTPEDLEKFEAEAKKIIAQDSPFERSEMSIDEAIPFFEKKGESFKAEIIRDLREKQGATAVSLYKHGDWIDLCRGPHLPSTGRIGALKLLTTSGAYWRGDHRNPMLQRIYGTAWRNQKELDAYLHRIEEAKRRDHRKLGKELELFAFHPFAPGAAFWLPKGTTLYSTLQDAMRRLTRKNGYLEVKTPLLFNKGLWEISGHWGKYRENMFLVLDSETKEHDFSLKPMNCPSHHLIFKMGKRSYRELPLRLHSQDVLHRNEPSGTLGGLTRVRQFQQDDAHIYMAESQILDEVRRLVAEVDTVYKALQLKYTAKFSTRPETRIGDDTMWDRAEASLRGALEALGMKAELKPGEGAFYGPKIDFDVEDAIGRKWQVATIQLDYAAPERFDLTYVGDDNKEHRPVIIHRAVYGSFERFIAILVEHFAGAFPPWLAPVQAAVLPVSDKFLDYARETRDRIAEAGFRVELDESNEKLGAKIRLAEMGKVPYIVVVGEKEQASGAVTPRRHGGKDLGAMSREAFAELLRKEASPPF
jgi:threonyl-tRNA synthetase